VTNKRESKEAERQEGEEKKEGMESCDGGGVENSRLMIH
jgi:hypothetical protein